MDNDNRIMLLVGRVVEVDAAAEVFVTEDVGRVVEKAATCAKTHVMKNRILVEENVVIVN